MSQSKLRLFREFIVTQYNFLTFYPIVCTFTVLTQAIWPPERPRLWVWLLGGLVCFGLYLVRSRVNNFVLLILLHLVALAAHVGLSQILSSNDNLINMLLYLAFSIAFVSYSIRQRFRTDSYEDDVIGLHVSVGSAALLILIQRYVSEFEWTKYYALVVIVQIGIYFLQFYISEYRNFLTVNANSTGIIPEKEIFRSGMALASFYTFGSVLVLLLVSQWSWLGRIVEWIRLLIVAIVGLLYGESDGVTPVQEIVEHSLVEDDKSITVNLPASDGSPLWDILFAVIIIICAVLLLFALYKAICRLVQIVYGAYKNKRKSSDEGELNEIMDVREKLEIRKNTSHRRKPREWFGFLSAQERIRHVYKKNVSRYKPNRLIGSEKQRKDDFTEERLKFYTAREMEERMEASFADIYEKARYSDAECTSQDVKAMEAAFK